MIYQYIDTTIHKQDVVIVSQATGEESHCRYQSSSVAFSLKTHAVTSTCQPAKCLSTAAAAKQNVEELTVLRLNNLQDNPGAVKKVRYGEVVAIERCDKEWSCAINQSEKQFQTFSSHQYE